MITLATKVKNLAFLVVAVLVLGLVAVRYADLGRYLGLSGYYTVHVDLAATGGLFPHADVTYRGVSVGRVGAINLTPDGVTADLRINDSAPRIPREQLTATVADLSVMGEQYIDLRPNSDQGPYLVDGSHVRRSATSVPAPVTTMLSSVDNLAGSVPLSSLQTVVDELGKGFTGQGGNLQSLLDTSSAFVQAAHDSLPATQSLIVDGSTVLRTQADESGAITGFATSARQLATQLVSSDSDLRRLVATVPVAAEQVTGLLKDLDPQLSVLIANLTTTDELFVTRQNGVQELLVRLPQAAEDGASAVTAKGARFGLAVTFFAPLPCTAGYGSTKRHNGLDTGTASALNTGAGCTAAPSSGTDVRGSANAPKGGTP
ncbi:MCE family protein [Streptacidiphilus sp. N1-12]|uniref:MCE family protein n=2 Tax=Streptacidiphilus alkalitolerans TaxID=3342712 RepID=A0ABV6V5B1_9ACTN